LNALNIDFNQTVVLVKPNIEILKTRGYFIKNVSAGLAFPRDLYRRKLHFVARIPQLALYTISIIYIQLSVTRAVFFIINLIRAKAEKHDYLA